MSLIILLLLVSVTQGNILTQLVNSVRYVWAAKHQDCPTTCGNAMRISNCTSDLCQGIQIEAHNCLHLPPCSKICFSAFGHLPRKISSRPNLHYFNVRKLPFLQKKDILNATLFVHLPRAPKNGDADVWIDTHKLTLNQVGNVVVRRITTNHVELDHHFGGWVNINVTDVVHQWLEHPSTNFGLELKVWGSRPMKIIIPPKNPSEVLTLL